MDSPDCNRVPGRCNPRVPAPRLSCCSAPRRWRGSSHLFVVRDRSQFRNQLIVGSVLFFLLLRSGTHLLVGPQSRWPAICVAVSAPPEWRRTDADDQPPRPRARHACLLEFCRGCSGRLCRVRSCQHCRLSPQQRKAQLRLSDRKLLALGWTHPLRFRTHRQ